MSPRPKPAPDPVTDETPARGTQTDAAIKATWSQDKEGAVSGSLRVSGKVLAIVATVLGLGGAALGYAGRGEPEKAVAIEARLTKLETAVATMDGKLDVLINRKGN